MSNINYSSLESFCLEPKEEVINIKKSFQQHLSLKDGKSYKPRLVLFDFFRKKKFALSSRDYIDQKDFYVSISEMLYSYSALSAHSSILVLDSNNKINNHSTGSLVVYFVSDDSAATVKLYYHQNNDATVEWIESQDTCEKIDLKSNDSSNKIIELLFVYTHIDPPFSADQMLSYYSMKKYNFMPFKNLKTSYINYNMES